MRTWTWLAMAIAWLASSLALALPPAPVVPKALEPWVPWLLQDRRDLLCPTLTGETRACTWPGHLTLRLDGARATFELDVWLDALGPVSLPGGKNAWPQAVLVDGEPALLLEIDAKPTLQLPAGHHKVVGQLQWGAPPERLAMPAEIGVVALQVDGKPLETPRRDGGELVLRQDGSVGAAAETDTLSASVARRVRDGVPLALQTRLVLRVGGKARDVVLGAVLPLGVRPVRVEAKVPLQVGADGVARVHVGPGQHELLIEAVLPEQVSAVVIPALQGDFWEDSETWVWQADEGVRSVELSGLTAIDPERTELPAEWKKGRTFMGQPGQALALKTSRRGEKEPAPNQLQLQRQWWLDLDGQGLTSRDQLTGEVYQGWRLDVAPGWSLGRADVAGTAQLVTRSKDGAGVELRQGKVHLAADLRSENSTSSINAVGWGTSVQSLRTTLHLPPGWRLLGASGVDEVPRTWLDSWTLYDFFFVLLTAIAAARLLGWKWAILALLGLVLAHDEADAPGGLWLIALGGLALLGVLPEGIFRRLVGTLYGLTLASLVVACLPFFAQQLRAGLYPQIERQASWLDFAAPSRDESPALEQSKAVEVNAAPETPAAAEPSGGEALAEKQMAEDNIGNARVQTALAKGEAKEMPQQQVQSRSDWSNRPSKGKKKLGDYSKIQQVDPHAVVQTGPGVPTWQWQSVQLGWSGPVRADHQISLWLLSPRMNLLLALLRVLLLGALLGRLLDWPRIRRWIGKLQVDDPKGGPGMGNLGQGAALLVLLASATLVAQPAQAQDEPMGPALPALLEQLGQKFDASQRCEGPCAVVSRLEMTLVRQQVELTLAVSAQRPAAVTLPGPLAALDLQEVRLDGQPTWQLRRLDNGLVQVRVPAGAHVITALGQLARRPVVDLQLDEATLPKQLVVRSDDWGVDGVDPDGAPETSLQLTRGGRAGAMLRDAPAIGAQEAALPAPATAGELRDVSQELPPWYRIERRLMLGMPWKVAVEVRREVADRPGLVRVPLLAGEAVLTEGVRVEDDAAKGVRVALVPFDRGEQSVSFESELPMPAAGEAKLVLRAPVGEPWTEDWLLDCSAIWQCSWPTGAQALPPSHTRDPQDHALRPHWQPWPGEQLELTIRRPAGAPGQSVTVESAVYRGTPGQRLLAAELELHIRASQGGERRVTLPEGADLQSITLNGQARALRPQGRVLTVPLEPGLQVVVLRWQQPWSRHFQETLPSIDLGGPVSNLRMELAMGEDRWLLWAHGPAWGAAVLFWSRLLLILLLAFGLSRVRGLPLGLRDWVLLGLGLVQFPIELTVLLIGWFVAMAWRRAYGASGKLWPAEGHDFLQLTLGGYSLLFLGLLYGSVHQNLLLDIDMQVQGQGSSEKLLRWYLDRHQGPTPEAGALSLPLWVWRGLMLGWALWLVSALLGWLRWGWHALVSGAGWKALTTRLPQNSQSKQGSDNTLPSDEPPAPAPQGPPPPNPPGFG